MRTILGLPGAAWADAIGLALLHSLWQASVVGLILAVTLRGLRRGAAQLRYLAACVALVAMLAIPVATVVLRGPMNAGDRGWRPATTVTRPVPPAGGPAVEGAGEPASWRAGFLVARPDGGWPRAVPAGLAAAWLVGVVVLTMRLIGGWMRVRRLRRDLTRRVEGGWDEAVVRIGRGLGIRRGVALLESSLAHVPMVVGWLRPAILLPVSTLAGLGAEQVEAILAHELAHIRRHDYLVNLVQSVLDVLLFYHPAAHWASRVIRCEREHCCDDLAVSACGNRLVYAKALAALEESRVVRWSLSQAVTGGTLLTRVRRILGREEESMKPFGAVSSLAIILLTGPALAVGAWALRVDASGPEHGGVEAVRVADSDQPPGSGATSSGEQARPSPAAKSSVEDRERRVRFDSRWRKTAEQLGQTRRFSPMVRAEPARTFRADSYQGVAFEQGWGKLDFRGSGRESWVKDEAGEGSKGKIEGKGFAWGRTDRDPPTEAEIWRRIPEGRGGKLTADNVRILVEKIADRVDPCKIYPLAGPCELVHAHYKCTVYFDERVGQETHHRVEVVYLDKDFLRRCQHEEARPDVDVVERKLDRLIQELEGLKRDLRR